MAGQVWKEAESRKWGRELHNTKEGEETAENPFPCTMCHTIGDVQGGVSTSRVNVCNLFDDLGVSASIEISWPLSFFSQLGLEPNHTVGQLSHSSSQKSRSK